jgi:hypothetical protein
VVPYFLYVIRFLEPRTVIARISTMAIRLAARAPSSPRAADLARLDLPRYLSQLGSVLLKGIDRVDRPTTVQGVAAIRATLQAFGVVKPALPARWFEVSQREFPGLGDDALTFIGRDRAYIEVGAMQQLIQAFHYALPRMPDAISAISAALRDIAKDAMRRDDIPAIESCIRTFNTFLRLGIRKKEPHSVFDALTHYRALAEALAQRQADQTVAIAGHLVYYGAAAKEAGMSFIPELFAYDLSALLRSMVQNGTAGQAAVLGSLVSHLRALEQAPTLPLVCAALVTLGALAGRMADSDLDALVEFLSDQPRELVRRAFAIIERTRQPRFWEMTDRQEDFNYLTEDRLEALRRVLADRVAGVTAAAQPAPE